ncbi:MAG: TonB-dependent receptor [Acidobacteriota bacterium]
MALPALLSLGLLLATAASAQDPNESQDTAETDLPSLDVYDEVEVRERADTLIGIASSAAEGVTGGEDLRLRPIDRPGRVLETVPGAIATQHSGGGKANQFFLRGFNLDHGTDFAMFVDGIPINMPSHGHGQGYADLNFLIPELVDTVRYRKGPYSADVADFSSAGSAQIEMVDRLDGSLMQIEAGSDSFGRVVYGHGQPVGEGHLTAAVELFHQDGPWRRGDDFDGLKAFARYDRGDERRGTTVTATAYDTTWLSTDQVPLRAINSGFVDRFAEIDPGPRGATERFSLSVEGRRGDDDSLLNWQLYALSYDFLLISNFTYFLDFPELGDQFEQVDDRLVLGGRIDQRWATDWGGRRFEHRAGFDLRFDDIENGLFRTSELDRFATIRRDTIEQFGGGPFVETHVHLTDWLRARAGVRAQGYLVDVASDLDINSGDEDDVLIAPHLSLAFGPWNDTEFYVNFGRGLHSNDARGATLRFDPASGEAGEPVDPLVRADGIDVGFRTTAIEGLHTTVTVFQLELDSELLFVGDGGATEASRPSRRRGVEWTNVYSPRPWLTFDLDITWTDAEFTDTAPEGDEIPGSIGRTIAAGVRFDDRGPVYGALRWRSFSDVPLIEDGSAVWDDSERLDGLIGWRINDKVSLELEALNLLDSEDSDIEYFYASRLPGEPADGIEDVHLHPIEPLSARLSLVWRN